MGDYMEDFVETVKTGVRPEVLMAFDRFTGEIEDTYPQVGGTSDIDIRPETSFGIAYAGPVAGGEAHNRRSYTAVADYDEVGFDVRVKDYMEPEIKSMTNQEGEEKYTVIVPSVEPSRARRDIVLENVEGGAKSDTIFNLIGDAVYTLLDGHVEDYHRSDDPLSRTFTFERSNLDDLDLL